MSIRKLAVIMDPIESINPAKDSSLAMMLEAQNRGWKIYYAELHDIYLEDGKAFGRLSSLKVKDDTKNWFTLGATELVLLGDMDVILMRKDPPFDIEYITATYILEIAENQGTMVINRPQSLRDANEKTFLAWFPDCAPPTLISRSLVEMNRFIDEHKKVVLKPLDLMGGKLVFVTDSEDGNRNVILETLTHTGEKYAMAQKYIPEIVESGDKRIILIDGEPIPMALARIPNKKDHRGNLSTGALADVRALTERDLWICKQISPILREKGLLFAGIDIIGDYITEINVTSPTGIQEIENACDIRISELLFDVIETKLEEG